MTKKDIDAKPPRFMVVLVDFQTDTQRQIGAPELDDIFRLNKNGTQLSSDFKKFVDYFKELVKDAEKDPWAGKKNGKQ